MVYFEDKTNRKKKTAALLLYTQLEHDSIILQEQHHLLQVFGFFIIMLSFKQHSSFLSSRAVPTAVFDKLSTSTINSITVFFVFFFCFFFNSVLRPFQDYFSSYETGQSVGGRKRENPEKNHLAHPQAELGLSHMWPVRGSNPHQTQLGWS